jgi:hypothetical protein
MERMPPIRPLADLGTLAPLILVAIYFAVVASFPGVDVAQLAALTFQYIGIGLSLLLVVSLGAFSVVLVVKLVNRDLEERPLNLAKRLVLERWRADRGLAFLVAPLVFALLLPSFNAFKQTILPYAGFGLDATFAGWDRMLFLGADPWRISHALFEGPDASWVISRLYHQLYFPMAIGVFICAVVSIRPALRTQYLLSYALVWIAVGSVFAFLLPSAGPVYWHLFHSEPDPFAPLVQMLAEHDRLLVAAGHAEGLSAVHFQRVIGDAFQVPQLAIGRGISAMPSVHIALAVQFACGAFAIRRWLGWVLAVYSVVIWIGSIHLGWHYALDGIVAAAIIIPIWLLCGRLARRLHGEADVAQSSAVPVVV